MVGCQRRGKRAPRVAGISGSRPGTRAYDGRLQRAIGVNPLGYGPRGPDVPSGKACLHLDLGQLSFEPSRDTPAGSCLGHELRGDVCASLGEASTCGYQPCDCPDQLVWACAKGGVCLLEKAPCLAHLIAL
jgi:hypothetical protein